MATAAKKVKRSCKVLNSWFSELEFQGMFRHNHPNNTNTSLYCLLCDKLVVIEHQGKLDLTRHCRGKSHTMNSMMNAKRAQGSITSHFNPQSSDINQQISLAEVKVAGFLAEHNLPFATADHLGRCLRVFFQIPKLQKATHVERPRHPVS